MRLKIPMLSAICAALLFLRLNAVAQNAPYVTSKVIPPSPTTASLGKYGNVPVSFYNGTPSISIPLYDVQTAKHNLKIAMQYDASGIRVQQDASWVGLGWSLMAGGVVSRTVRQLDDFTPKGYFFTGPLAAPSGGNTTINYMTSVFSNDIDAEQDIFSYNFAGYSGRFVLGKKIDGAQVYADDKNNLKIQYLDTQGKWVITTPDGYVYTFSTTESAQDYGINGLSEFNNINGVQGFNLNLDSDPITGWFLDSIVSPDSETISFEYVKGKSLSMVSKGETYSQLLNVPAVNCNGDYQYPNIGGTIHSYSASRQALIDVYLKRITYARGSIEFNASPRSDMEYITSSENLLTPSKLDNIVIKDVSGAQLKKYIFSYSYFNNTASSSGRLKLDNITELSATGNSKPPYAFTYLNPNDLPNKYSKSLDHWGFYNDKPNYTLLPSTEFGDAAVSFQGADREPDIQQVFPANGVLSQIQYPTGGKTTFEYELNDYSNLTEDQRYTMVNRYASVYTDASHPGQDEPSTTFYIPPRPDDPEHKKLIPVTLSCGYSKLDPNVTDVVSLGYSNFWRVNDDGSTTAISGCSSANYDQPNPGQTFYVKNLKFGNFKMYVLGTLGYRFFMSASWQDKVEVTEKKGGGIRIKRITDIDQAGNTNVRRFQYKGDDDKSSGILLLNPIYSARYLVQGLMRNGAGTYINQCSYVGEFGAIMSNSIYANGLSGKAGIVGYTKVTELLGENGENGHTDYYFHNAADQVPSFPSLPIAGDPLNGKMDSVNYITATGVHLKKDAYTYDVKETNSVAGIKLFTDASLQQNAPPGLGYYAQYYNSVSNWVVPISETETLYDGSTAMTTTKQTFYDNIQHRQPTKTITVNSDSKIIQQEFNYPHEMVAKGVNPGNVYSDMINANMVAPVVETINSVDNAQQDKRIANYANIGFGTIIDKVSEDYQYRGGAIDPQASYEYTAAGNIKTVFRPNGSKTTYLWGYNQQYPIAQLVNASYQDVVAVLGQANIDLLAGSNPGTDAAVRTILDVLRTDVRLKAAQVTTFTYSPGAGVTSATDPRGNTIYYEYDDFQRLMNLKDQNGKIVKSYDYHYHQP